MNQRKMEQDFRRIFKTLMNGNPSEFKAAKKEIERLWHQDKNREFQKYAPIALEYIKQFDDIKSAKNQAAFVSGLSLFFLSLSDEYFDVLKKFVMKAIRNPDGHTREATRKTADWLYVSLSNRMDPFTEKKLTPRQKNEKEKARKQYFAYLKEIEFLMDKYYDESRDKARYIDGLEPSVYKSLQLLWHDLTRGKHIYLDDNPSEELLAKREEIKNKISDLLKEIGSEFNFEDIVDIVYNEDNKDAFREILKMFDKGQDVAELQKILNAVSDVWNHFPHKTLGGKCPYQMVEDYRNQNQ